MTQLAIFDQSETTILKQFFLNLYYCFLFLVRYCLDTCVNCVANCITQKIYPLEVRILPIIFFNIILWTIWAIIPHIWAHIIKTVFFSKLELLVSVLGSMVSKNTCKLCHKLKNAKNLPNSLGHDKINLDIILDGIAPLVMDPPYVYSIPLQNTCIQIYFKKSWTKIIKFINRLRRLTGLTNLVGV